MEIQIQDLITSIKSDGINKAKAESDQIIAKAKADAEAIIKNANDEKEKILISAKREIEVERRSAEEKLKQAARDASLSLRRSLEDEVRKILREEISSSIDSRTYQDIILSASNAILGDAEIVISEKEKDKISADTVSKLAEKMKKGLSLKTSSALSGGLIIREKDGSGYFDLSDEEIAKLLYPYLSESLRKLL